jgi:hypothetical protein
MLAYVFWHRPRPEVAVDEYERALVAFHRALATPSAAFRLDRLPWLERDGYEDWYMVDGWEQLGALNRAAVSGAHQAPHDAVAGLAGEGWAGIYALVRGTPAPPDAVRWASKPPDQSYRDFFEREPAATIWQRQMTLGPAPEFALGEERPAGRLRLTGAV